MILGHQVISYLDPFSQPIIFVLWLSMGLCVVKMSCSVCVLHCVVYCVVIRAVVKFIFVILSVVLVRRLLVYGLMFVLILKTPIVLNFSHLKVK